MPGDVPGKHPSLEHVREEVLFDHFAPDVADEDVRFLDAGGDVAGDDHAGVAEVLERAAAAAEEADGGDAVFLGFVDSVDDVLAGAAGGDGHEGRAGTTVGFDAAREDVLVADVVAPCRHDGRVDGEGKGGNGRTVDVTAQSNDEFGGKVLTVGGRSAVAAEHDELALAGRVAQELAASDDVGRTRCGKTLLGRDGVGDDVANTGRIEGIRHAQTYVRRARTTPRVTTAPSTMAPPMLAVTDGTSPRAMTTQSGLSSGSSMVTRTASRAVTCAMAQA